MKRIIRCNNEHRHAVRRPERGGDITTTHDIDNWSVTVNTAIEIAEPGLGTLFGIGLLSLGIVRRRATV